MKKLMMLALVALLSFGVASVSWAQDAAGGQAAGGTARRLHKKHKAKKNEEEQEEQDPCRRTAIRKSGTGGAAHSCASGALHLPFVQCRSTARPPLQHQQDRKELIGVSNASAPRHRLALTAWFPWYYGRHRR